MKKVFYSEHTGAEYPDAWHECTGGNVNANKDADGKTVVTGSVNYAVYFNKKAYTDNKTVIGNYSITLEENEPGLVKAYAALKA